MKIRTSELTGAALTYAMLLAEGVTQDPAWDIKYMQHNLAEDWSYAGPIIEREKIHLSHYPYGSDADWTASMVTWWDDGDDPAPPGYNFEAAGSTPLIAAMRCYVASVKGEEIDIPEELV